MPANEQTWRDQKKMHIFFAVSTLIMGIATIWMMAADHMREWKDWQLKDRKKDAWMLASQRDSLAAQYSGKSKTFEDDIRALDSTPIDPGVVERFETRVYAESKRDAKEATPPAVDPKEATAASDFAKLNELVKKMNEAADKAAKDRAEAKAAGLEETSAAALKSAQDEAIATRKAVLAEVDKFIREARRKENQLVGDKKAQNGVRTALVSEVGILIGQGDDKKALEVVQPKIDELDKNLADLTGQIASAKAFRMDLEGLVAEANAKQLELQKSLDAMKTDLSRLDDQVYKNTSNFGEWVTRLPVLNALYSGNIKIDQIWLPDMTIDYNFAQAARFDRCTTCHRAISTTAPGAATDPLYPTLPDSERRKSFTMATPEKLPEGLPPDAEREKLVLADYGLALSPAGIINDADVTVHYVLPESPAARAGLQAGDKILSIGGETFSEPATARKFLLQMVKPAATTTVEVWRGLDHPFTAHPRLDLYLSDMSPHPQKDIGCTICHDGQGSGTAFPWTSHTPDDARQQDKWAHEHGWFDNHHWIFPMRPARFVESNCMKCHHQKGSLEPSERFPDPPAPKLVAGWTTVEKYGCFGCHEINGYDSPKVTLGPDVRLEPLYHEAAAQILRDPKLNDDEKDYAHRLIAQPADAEARELLFAAIKHDESPAAEAGGEAQSPRLSDETHKLASSLKPIDMPGRMRKVGPSLRYINAKVGYDWIYSWIRQPSNFRPTTKMPQFFGQYEHLTEVEDADQLKDSIRFEPIEIRALTEYLLAKSDKFEYIEREKGVEQASAERGKWLFQSRGCLACHSHKEFPGIASTQGPDLSRIGAKFNNETGRKWLYSWLKQPNKYHARTVMPNLFLNPIEEKDAQGKPTGKVTDPAADIAEFLMGVPTDWRPTDVPARGQLSDEEKLNLKDLAVQWLKSDTIPKSRAEYYLEHGIDESQASKLKADEKLLVNWKNDPYVGPKQTEKQLEYVARRTIGKYGCFGCHDIPGFEDAKPIGTALVDWGRKETSKLAFENIHKFLETHGIKPPQPTEEELQRAREAKKAEQPAEGAVAQSTEPVGEASHGGHLDPGSSEFSGDESYFIQSLNSHGRDGFLWEKLRYPRSYDYKTTRNKNFNERLRMPRFPFDDKEREEVMTFILGLVKEPPASKYIYKPSPRQQAIVDGRAVLERFNCMGCHTLRMEEWKLAYDENTFEAPPEVVDYPFLAPQFSDTEIAASMAKDSRGMLHATLQGEPVTDPATGQHTWVDDSRTPITPEDLKAAEQEGGESVPVFYLFTLWKDVLINGQPRLRGMGEVLVPADRAHYGPANGAAYPAWGGDLARYLFPHAIVHAKETGSQANPKEAWGWLPPPLMDEGVKVQSDWLHEFLMDPTSIRPAVVLRMPNFHMSGDEASKLVDYFAAASGAEFPYEYRPQQRPSYLAEVSTGGDDRLAHAMNIVVDQQYCVKCHSVGDFHPQGDSYTFGPNLAEVYRRLRPKFTRNWIANPVRILPYTGMPKNIPYHPTDEAQDGISEKLYPGNSIRQLTALVDLLMNFDVYAKSRTAIAPLVKPAAPAAGAAGGAGAQGAGQPPADTGASTDQPNNKATSTQSETKKPADDAAA